MSTSRISLFTIASLLCLTASMFAQKDPDVRSKPIKAKSEIKDAHKRWINEDVSVIVSDAERKAFLALKTDEERDAFIQTFWDTRDPNPDTEENEFREEYYERIAYANENFSSGIPGWKTDRGRIYIRWGKPDSIESRPSGGSYERPSYEGGGSTTVYPFETWFYRHLEGVGDGIEVEFVDPSGTGEYRIARNPDEKNAMANVPGGFRRAADSLTNSNPSYQREQDGMIQRMATLASMEKNPGPKGPPPAWFRTGEGTVLNENPIDVDHRIDFFKLSDDRVIVAFTLQTDNRQLQFEKVGGLHTAKMNIFGRVTSVAGRRGGVFEDAVTANATQQDLAEMKERKSIYQKVLALTPGYYKIDLTVRDVSTGNLGVIHQGFMVPKYVVKKLSTSTMMLASKLRSTAKDEPGAMFVIGNAKVVPNLTGVYKQGQDIGVYMQVYNAGIDQTTLRPDVDVEYVVSKDGKELFRQSEDWSGLSDSGQRLTLARLLPSDKLPLGEYEIKVVTKDRVGGQAIENKAKFTITK